MVFIPRLRVTEVLVYYTKTSGRKTQSLGVELVGEKENSNTATIVLHDDGASGGKLFFNCAMWMPAV